MEVFTWRPAATATAKVSSLIGFDAHLLCQWQRQNPAFLVLQQVQSELLLFSKMSSAFCCMLFFAIK